MADSTIRTCFKCDTKFYKGYGERFCPNCRRFLSFDDTMFEVSEMFDPRTCYWGSEYMYVIKNLRFTSSKKLNIKRVIVEYE